MCSYGLIVKLLSQGTQHSWPLYAPTIVRSRFSFHTQADVRASLAVMFSPQPFISAFDVLFEVRSDKANSKLRIHLSELSKRSRGRRKVGDAFCLFRPLSTKCHRNKGLNVCIRVRESEGSSPGWCMKRESTVRPISPPSFNRTFRSSDVIINCEGYANLDLDLRVELHKKTSLQHPRDTAACSAGKRQIMSTCTRY